MPHRQLHGLVAPKRLLALACAVCMWATAATANQPNFVVIFPDNVGMNDLSCYGSEIPTPNIDRIARTGIKFERWYSGSPVCTPSRFSLLTGRFPNRSQDKLLSALMPTLPRDSDRGIRPHETTIAEVLKRHGYRTACIGKWHLGHGDVKFLPTRHGFDSFYGFTPGCIDYFRLRYGQLRMWYRNEELVDEEGYATHLLADEIAERSARAQTSEPAAPGPGFVPIFNGKDLTGWDADPRWWSATENALVGQKADEDFPHHEYAIWADGTVKDFELRLKFRSTTGNSGIDYRADRVWKDPRGNPVRRFVQGYQADIMRDVNTGALYNWRCPGAPYGQFVVVEGEREATVRSGEVADTEALHWAGYCKTGQWNDYTIVARGSHILHRINGSLVTEFIDNGPYARREGLLGVQIHGGDKPFLNEFKDVFLKRFSAPFWPAHVLFSGKDLQGWTTPDGGSRRTTWNAIDGVLSSKDTGALVTTKKYADYVLRFQFRRPRVKRSAIALRMASPDQARSKCIRVSGEGDDFNWIRTVGGFRMEQRKADKELPTLPELPEQFWNDCEITLNGGELEVKVNDSVRATATGCERVSGHIGFVNLDATTGIQYRNIVLIPIVKNSTTPESR